MKILIHLISGQNAPNYFASETVKPDKNIFVFSEGSKNQKNIIKAVLKDTESEEISVNAFDYNDCLQKCSKLIEQHPFDELILNFTGGTKIMSASFLKGFNLNNLLSIYIDSENTNILYLRGDNSEYRNFNINIPLDKYFLLYGHKFEVTKSLVINEELKTGYVHFLENNFSLFSEFLFDINKKLGNKLLNKLKSLKEINKSESKIVYDDATKNIDINFIKERLNININFQFSNPSNSLIKFILSGWFEDLIFEKLSKFNIFSDIQRNINVKFKNNNLSGNPINEIDIAAVFKNKLFFFEVKSGGYNQDNINKLKAIKENFGGTYSVPVFITYFPPSQDILNRIKEYGIQNFTFNNLDKLKNFIVKSTKKNINL